MASMPPLIIRISRVHCAKEKGAGPISKITIPLLQLLTIFFLFFTKCVQPSSVPLIRNRNTMRLAFKFMLFFIGAIEIVGCVGWGHNYVSV